MKLKKTVIYTIVLIIITLLICLTFCGCDHIESKDTADYKDFMLEMRDKDQEVYKFFPDLKDTDCIEDMFLYYSDRDLFDSKYTIYLKCSYDAETYASEIERLEYRYNKFSNNSDFEYDSAIAESISNILGSGKAKAANIRYTYALRNEKNYEIIYVAILKKGDTKIITENIPIEYLPKDLPK